MTWLAALGFSLAAHATGFSAIAPNNEGVADLMKDNPHHAYQKFIEAAGEDSFDPTIRLNLGLTYSVNKENDKALSEFRAAEQLSGDNQDLKFKARFNQGVVLATDGKIPEALRAYQAALDLKPDSLEAKTNIELLWQAQQGGGKGKNDQQQKGKDKQDGQGGQGEQDKQDQGQNDQQPEQKEKDKPKPFDSQDVSQETMRKILEELKAQEQRVRAEHYSKGAKERPRDKDW